MAAAARIRAHRRLKGMSQEELALQAGLNPAYFGQVERGIKCPTIDTLCKIAAALNIPPSELLRAESSVCCAEENLGRMKDLLSCVPEEKLDHFFKTMEDMLKLL